MMVLKHFVLPFYHTFVLFIVIDGLRRKFAAEGAKKQTWILRGLP
jgi:hypothetical protein